MKNEFGGSLLYKKRKSKRPLDFKRSTHLVLRLRPKLPAFFNPRDRKFRKLLFEVAAKYESQIYQLVLNHTHCHIVIKFSNRKSYVRFIRAVTSKLVKLFSEQIKIRLKDIFEWRPWTRMIQWGRDFTNIMNYMRKNETESGIQQLNGRCRIASGPNLKIQLFLQRQI